MAKTEIGAELSITTVDESMAAVTILKLGDEDSSTVRVNFHIKAHLT